MLESNRLLRIQNLSRVPQHSSPLPHKHDYPSPNICNHLQALKTMEKGFIYKTTNIHNKSAGLLLSIEMQSQQAWEHTLISWLE